MLTILHASDLQYGRPFLPGAGDALVDLCRTVAPDLVVVAGDLTQRAKRREYEGAAAFLQRLGPAPVVVTPGNHDVPLYRVWERLAAPYRNWRRTFGPELDTVRHVPGATVVALNSSAPRRAVVGGRLDAGQVAFARRAFARTVPPAARVVVTHHHFLRPPGGEGGRPLPGAAGILAAFEEMGVDLVLGGHVHQTHVYTSRDVMGGEGAGIVLAACGTSASSRGRGPERARNSVNVVRIDGERLEITPCLRVEEGAEFVPGEPLRFPRRASRAGTVPGTEATS